MLERENVEDVLASSSNVTYKITYSVNGHMGGSAFSGRWITYQLPPYRRIDIAYGGIATYQSETAYYTPTTVYFCALPYTPPCRAATLDDARAAGAVGIDELLLTNARLFEGAQVVDDRVAGQDVICFKIRPDDAGKLSLGSREFDACYTADGLPMRMEIYGPDVDLELEGILLLRDFPPSDVQLPAGALGIP